MMTIVAVICTAKAQIPNAGFEDWTTTGSYEQPNEWATMNPSCTGPFYSCTKSNDHFPVSAGSFSVRIENNTALGQMAGGWGLIASKTMSYPMVPAFPVTGHPDSLFGYYKLISLNSDTAWIKILLYDGGLQVLDKNILLPAAPSWTSFSVPLGTYSTADSAMMILAAFFPNNQLDGPNGNSVVYFDNLSFDNLVGSVNENNNTPRFSMYPNPAIDVVTLNIDTKTNDVKLNIYNVIGGIVRSEPLQNNRQNFSTGDLNNGIYIVEIRSEKGSSKQKLIIQK